MATPARLVEVACPRCHQAHWEIDNDYRGVDGRGADYPHRRYVCPGCGCRDPGWEIRQKSPPEFFLQPHPMYPMTQREFDRWCSVLRQHFPDHPFIPKIGGEFRPNTHVIWTRLENYMLRKLKWP